MAGHGGGWGWHLPWIMHSGAGSALRRKTETREKSFSWRGWEGTWESDTFLRGFFSDSLRKAGGGLAHLSRYDYIMLYIPLVHIVLFYLHFDVRWWTLYVVHVWRLWDCFLFLSYVCYWFHFFGFDLIPLRDAQIMLLFLLKMCSVSLTCLSSLFRAWNRASFDGLPFSISILHLYSVFGCLPISHPCLCHPKFPDCYPTATQQLRLSRSAQKNKVVVSLAPAATPTSKFNSSQVDPPVLVFDLFLS